MQIVKKYKALSEYRSLFIRCGDAKQEKIKYSNEYSGHGQICFWYGVEYLHTLPGAVLLLAQIKDDLPGFIQSNLYLLDVIEDIKKTNAIVLATHHKCGMYQRHYGGVFPVGEQKTQYDDLLSVKKLLVHSFRNIEQVLIYHIQSDGTPLAMDDETEEVETEIIKRLSEPKEFRRQIFA